MPSPTLTVFAPHPLLTVTIEREGTDRERVHVHAGGQGVWVARMSGELGARPVLCGFVGGETGELLRPLLERLPGRRALVASATPSGCSVTDRRSGERRVVSLALSDPPSRHELDELFSRTCVEALGCGWLVVTNPLPGDALPLELYRDLVTDARVNGVRVLVDLSAPRVDQALKGEPDLVKLNDWELAEYVCGPVDGDRLIDAAERIRDRGARNVIVTRGEQPALVLTDTGQWWLEPPRFVTGSREGCGDAMLGALAARWAAGDTFEHALITGAAAGAANFLRHGIGSASRKVVQALTEQVRLYPADMPSTARGVSRSIRASRAAEHTV
ncbi:MAG TPA: PfkB family carbohydrate kinase [Solirubrobacteraceae bacterium]|nr:PfkB family carbohydrate kinase [Solirubrobacteraceae bacterium]